MIQFNTNSETFQCIEELITENAQALQEIKEGATGEQFSDLTIKIVNNSKLLAAMVKCGDAFHPEG